MLGTFRALGPKAWTALKRGKPQALTELSESRPSEPGLEVLGSMGEVLGRQLGGDRKPSVSEVQGKNLSNA